VFPVHYVYAEEANQGSNVLVRISSSLYILREIALLIYILMQCL